MNLPNLSGLSVRHMVADDLPQVHRIESAVQSHPWRIGQLNDSLLSGHLCTVLLLNAKVVGFCILQPVLDEANLLLMAIDPAQQGQGLGFYLLDQSIQQLPNCMMIFLEVRISNASAIALYEKTGFNQMGIRKNYYPTHHGKEDALLMALTLGNPFVS